MVDRLKPKTKKNNNFKALIVDFVLLFFLPQMQKLGILNNNVSGQSIPEVLFPMDIAEWHLVKDYDLLYCFRRDSNKVQNYLKILKCRIVPEHGC